MNLLIITQKIDREDPVLGFFHNWVEKLSQKIDSIVVICLEKGEYNLPENVEVHSLGKEAGKNRLQILFTFYFLTFSLRRHYDAVFVHMNQEYVLLAGILWRFLGKKILLWRNHKLGNLFTDVAILLSNKIFYTSPFSYTAKSKKAIKMPVGIDTDIFKPASDTQPQGNSILFLGRISPIKNPNVFIKALKILKDKNVDFKADIYGDALPKDEKFYQIMRKEVLRLGLDKVVEFHQAVPNYETPNIYRSHQIYVNLTESGSMDKTIFEAMACGCLPVITNTSLNGQIDNKMIANLEPESLANSFSHWLSVDDEDRKITSKKLQKYVSENHSLEYLINSLDKEFLQ